MSQLNQQAWDAFVQQADGGSFLQSWLWGEVQEAFGVSRRRLAVWEEEKLVGVALVVQRSLPVGRHWLYIPRGPLPLSVALERQVRDLALEQDSLFVRIEPHYAPGGASRGGFSFRKADHDIQPRHSLVVALSQSEETLLAAMHHKTRYNIRLAGRRGVTVRFSRAERDLAYFLELAREVSSRGAFHFHPNDYYRALWRVLSPAGALEIAVAEQGSTVLAVHLLISFGDTVTYAHGASRSSHRDLMAPHLLQWESMRRAKEAGYAQYDFFGVAPAGQPHHPWAGVTRFKEGFGGQRVRYPGAYDLVLHPAGYLLYRAARRLRG